MFCKVIPYTTEDDITLCEPFDKVMMFLTNEAGSDPDHILDNIPKEAAETICDFINDGDQKHIDLDAAARTVLDGLNSRIAEAPEDAVPVFTGIVELHDALKQPSR